MKVLLFGATGRIGSAIAAELRSRGHSVTGVTRGRGDDAVAGDATEADSVAELAPGHDAVVSAIGPSGDPGVLVTAALGLVNGLRRTAVRRLVVVGGAGSLDVGNGVRLADTPEFPEAWRPTALAHADALNVYRAVDDLDWTFFSPAALIEAGERTGGYRIGGDRLLTDDAGNSRITFPDFAIAVVDELEHPSAIRRRVTVAY